MARRAEIEQGAVGFQGLVVEPLQQPVGVERLSVGKQLAEELLEQAEWHVTRQDGLEVDVAEPRRHRHRLLEVCRQIRTRRSGQRKCAPPVENALHFWQPLASPFVGQLLDPLRHQLLPDLAVRFHLFRRHDRNHRLIEVGIDAAEALPDRKGVGLPGRIEALHERRPDLVLECQYRPREVHAVVGPEQEAVGRVVPHD